MVEVKHPLFEGYTIRGGESITKPTYMPDETVIEAFINGVAKRNLFKDKKPPVEVPQQTPQEVSEETKK